MLELASPALRKVTAWRHLVSGPMLKRSIVEQQIPRNGEGDVLTARADPVASRGDADDWISHKASAAGIAATNSSAIMAGPAISAARP